MHMPRRIVGSVVGGLLLQSCGPGAAFDPLAPPAVTAQQVLELGSDEQDESPFDIVSASPQGLVDDLNLQIHVAFSRPLRVVALAEDEPPPHFHVEPTIEGTFAWIGTRGIAFNPTSGSVAPATTYQVRVAEGTKALDGSRLERPYEFSFETPRPRIEAVTLLEDDGVLRPDSRFAIDVNLPMSPQALLRVLAVHSLAPGSNEEPVRVALTTDEEIENRFIVVPSSPLPAHRDVRIHVDRSLTSTLGPLGSTEETDITFATYAPLRVEFSCPGEPKPCNGRPWLHFNNEITIDAARRAIRVTPDIGLEVVTDGDEAVSEYFALRGRYETGVSYEVSVKKGLKDKFEQALAERFVADFTLGSGVKVDALGANFGFLEPTLGQSVRISTVNIPSYEQLTLSLTPEDVLRHERDGSLDFIEDSGFRRQSITGLPGLNRQTNNDVDMAEVLGQPGGALAVGYAFQNDEGATEQKVQVVHPTNLAVTTRLSPEGGLAWVTDMTHGRPVEGVALRFLGLDTEEATMTTDQNGLAKIDARHALAAMATKDASLLIGETSDDWSYTRTPSLQPVEYRTLTSLLTDRDAYRPGEPVYVKGWIREEARSGTQPVSDQELSVSLWFNSTKEQTVQAKTNSFGGFDVKLTVPSYASLGTHRIEIEGSDESGSRWISVKEFRPTEFSTSVKIPKAEHVVGEFVKVLFEGTYLFGGPMGDQQLNAFGYASPATFQPPGSERFAIGAWEVREHIVASLGKSLQREVAEHWRRLDAEGRASLDVETQGLGLLGPAWLEVSGVVSDASRQAVSSSAKTLLHAGDFYVGVQVPEGRVQPNRRFTTNLITVDTAGKRVKGHTVNVELYREPDHDDGEYTAKKVGSCSLVTAVEPVSCGLIPRASGRHFVLARSSDARGHALYSAASIYVESDDWGHNAVTGEYPSVELDRASYEVGQTAHATVSVPFPNADVLVTLENESIIWSGQARARGKVARFDIPVTAQVGRNATVVAHVAKGSRRPNQKSRSNPYRDDDAAPALHQAVTTLKIDQSARHLKIDVTPEKTVVAPGATVPVRFSVRDGKGNPRSAELVVFAVDEGVLSLTNYQTPDPFFDFTPLRDSWVRDSDTRAQLGWLYHPELEELAGLGVGHGRLGGSHASRAPKIRMGSTQVTGQRSVPPNPREDFRTTPFFNGSVRTDESGEVRIDVPLSQLLTSYRIMATATAMGDYFGSGESVIQTRSPLLLRPALPRFARVGDRFEVGVVISSTEQDLRGVVVSAQASGLNLVGSATRTVDVVAGVPKEVRFECSADRAGEAHVDFYVQGGSWHDSVRVPVPVSMPLAPQAVALYGKTQSVAGEGIGNLSKADPNYGELQVALSSTALVGLDQGIEQLIEYPYACTEQLSSRLLPLLPLEDLATDFGIALPERLDEEVAGTIQQLLERQKYDGGFGLWPEDPDSHPWLTAYVLRTLDEARKRGADVPPEALESAFAYLKRYAQEERESEFFRPTLAYIAYVFGEFGHPSRADIEYLLNGIESDPVFVKALVLHALSRLRDLRADASMEAEMDAAWHQRVLRDIERLSHSLESELTLSGNRASVETSAGYGWLFDSPARTSAMVLSALLAANPKHPMAEAMARGLLGARRGGTWRSTQETAYALLALDSYRRNQEATSPHFEAMVWLGDTVLGGAKHDRRSAEVKGFAVPLSRLRKDGSLLTFQKKGEGTLFYQALLSYSPKDLPTTPLEHGLVVDHRLYAVERGELPASKITGAEPSQSAFAAGSVVLGSVVVTTPVDREFVAIDIPLPAGVEALDTSFETARSEGIVDPSAAGYRGWFRRELRDDRVLFFLNRMNKGVVHLNFLARATTIGTFVLPPASAKEMYSPENFGRSAASTIRVHEVVRSKP